MGKKWAVGGGHLFDTPAPSLPVSLSRFPRGPHDGLSSARRSHSNIVSSPLLRAAFHLCRVVCPLRSARLARRRPQRGGPGHVFGLPPVCAWWLAALGDADPMAGRGGVHPATCVAVPSPARRRHGLRYVLYVLAVLYVHACIYIRTLQRRCGSGLMRLLAAWLPNRQGQKPLRMSTTTTTVHSRLYLLVY